MKTIIEECQIVSGVPNLARFTVHAFIACRTQVLENPVLSSDLSQIDLIPSQMQRLGKLLVQDDYRLAYYSMCLL